jgi:hypothetical protein
MLEMLTTLSIERFSQDVKNIGIVNFFKKPRNYYTGKVITLVYTIVLLSLEDRILTMYRRLLSGLETRFNIPEDCCPLYKIALLNH